MPTGRVTFFNDLKGYGFIEPDAGGDDVFVHISNVEKSGLNSLADRQPVECDVMINSKKGRTAAINLRV